MLDGIMQWLQSLGKMPMQSASNIPLQELTGISRASQPLLPPGIGGPMNQMQMIGQIMQGLGKSAQDQQQQPQMAPPPQLQRLGDGINLPVGLLPNYFQQPRRPRGLLY